MIFEIYEHGLINFNKFSTHVQILNLRGTIWNLLHFEYSAGINKSTKFSECAKRYRCYKVTMVCLELCFHLFTIFEVAVIEEQRICINLGKNAAGVYRKLQEAFGDQL